MEWRLSSQSFIHPEVEARRRNLELTHEEVAFIENGKVDTVRNWRKKHLTKAEYIACGGRVADLWTEREATIARKVELSNQQVADIIGRSRSAVVKWRHRNLSDLQKEEMRSLKGGRLSKKHRYEPNTVNEYQDYTLRDINKILDNWHIATRDLAQLAGRSESAMYALKNRLRKMKERLNEIEDL